MDEAISEALKALWYCAERFDPKRQTTQRQSMVEKAFWEIVCGFDNEPDPPTDPFKNFWISSVRRVRGSVLDYFRSERLITKRAPGDTTRTMLYAERFVSLDATLRGGFFLGSDHSGDAGIQPRHDSYGDFIAARGRTDEADDDRHRKSVLGNLYATAELTEQERKAIDLYYSDDDHITKAKVASMLGIELNKLHDLLDNALLKLRSVATVKSGRGNF